MGGCAGFGSSGEELDITVGFTAALRGDRLVGTDEEDT